MTSPSPIPPGKQIASYVLESLSGRALADGVRALADRFQEPFSAELGDVLANHLLLLADGDGGLTTAMDALAGQESSLAWYVRARLLADSGEFEAALAALCTSIQRLPAPDPYVLLHRARLLANRKHFTDAALDLQSALRLFPPYSFFIKCRKVLDRIAASGEWSPRRAGRLAILGSSTTAFLAPVLRASGFRSGLKLETYEGLFGNYQQEILDPASGLYRFRPDVVVLLVNHRDLSLPPSGGRQQALEFASLLRDLWEMLQRRHPCHVVQVGLDLPLGGAWGSLEDTLAEGRRRAVKLANLALSEDLPSGVSFVDVETLAGQLGSAFASEAEWHATRQYPALAALPLVADAIAAHCLAALGLGAKVLALDLDNTLWGGVIGEDLLGGIRIGPPTAEGEGYLELQKYAKTLHERGVLLAACSKNNQVDAELPFRRHDAMHLRLEDFTAFAANWQDKATNLEAIAAELSLGLDSFVFLDDNPAERALVRSRLPQVAVPECGQTPWEMLATLRRGMYFESIVLTEEDLGRNENYRKSVSRKMLRRSAATLGDFLSQLEMTAEHGPVGPEQLVRVTQLINKTNQFNLTTRRYTEEQVRAMAESPDWWCRWFKLRDRFGDYGLVGVILAQRGPRWRVDTWLMSCRVLGRKMEDFMGQVLLTAAKADGATAVVGEYIRSEKNTLVQDLYSQFGFELHAADRRQHAFDLERPIPECDFIRDQTAPLARVRERGWG